MACRSTSIETRGRARRAFTLVEIVVAVAVGLLVAAAIVALTGYTTRSFVAMTNYLDMALSSRMALDRMARDIRQNYQVRAYATNSITLEDANGTVSQYVWNPSTRKLFCVTGGKTNTYLTECDSLRFWIYQHNVRSNELACWDPATVANARLVQVTWTCSRQILSAKVNTEAVQSTTIALRNY
jgi:prepilin-type N-terminal cleavage/methylation domain-containing protein